MQFIRGVFYFYFITKSINIIIFSNNTDIHVNFIFIKVIFIPSIFHNKYNTNATIEVNNIVINIDFSIVISHPICSCITNYNKKIQIYSESFSNSTIKLSISSIGIRVVEHFFNNSQALTALELEITLLLYIILIILNVLKTSIPLLSE